MRRISPFIALFVVLINGQCDAASTQPAEATVMRTRQEVEALIQKEGSTPPDWWNAVKLNYPPTLDLTMKPGVPGTWDPNKVVGTYFWSVVNENPSKWKEGIKLCDHLMTLNKNDADKVKTMQETMAHLYQDCLFDYARAAYWRLKQSDLTDERLAQCYWKLGNKERATEILKQCGNDDTRHGSIIKLWADMGEFDIALKLADTMAKDDKADVAYLMAGETCRAAGRYQEAITWFEKVLTVSGAKAGRDVKLNKARAQASIVAIKLYDTLDLKRIHDGKYSDSSQGYTGPVNVEVSVKAGKIESIIVTKHTEKQYYGSIVETPRQIIQKQNVKGVDTYSSATITSEAIINASAKALAQGLK